MASVQGSCVRSSGILVRLMVAATPDRDGSRRSNCDICTDGDDHTGEDTLEQALMAGEPLTKQDSESCTDHAACGKQPGKWPVDIAG